MNVERIAERTMLCILNKGMWRPKKFHKRETDAERKRHNTGAATVLVRISDHPALKLIETLHNESYREHCKMTLPTIQEGSRLIPRARQLEHSDVMRRYDNAIATQVAVFMADYDSEKQTAPVRLNGLYDPDMWPKHDVVASKFYFASRYLTCPTDGAWSEWLAESAAAAEADVKERLTECLQSIVAGCKGNLHADSFGRLSDLLNVLPDLNLTDNDLIAQVAANAQHLAMMNPETLRKSPTHREHAADLAAQMVGILGAQ